MPHYSGPFHGRNPMYDQPNEMGLDTPYDGLVGHHNLQHEGSEDEHLVENLQHFEMDDHMQ